MIPNNSEEREKWNELYASLHLAEEEETLRQFGLEFAQKVLDLLPGGGRVLEMGSGAGWQSLALARTGKFEVTLLDFSDKALDFSRRLFAREKIEAEFIQADAFELGQGQFDLVFNSGVIEHYNSNQQSALLQSMASRSRKYVLVLAPNQLCEWYWLWRVQATADENWPFGKEAPVLDLSQVISQAGLHFIGQSYMGENWTESFINNISGMDEPLREIVLSIHRSMLLTAAQKSYLVAALGSVTPVQTTPTGWDKTVLSERPGTGEMLEALALSLSSSLGEKKLHRQYKAEKDGEISQLQSLVESLQVERDRQKSSHQENLLKTQEEHLLELEKLGQQNIDEVEALIQTQLTEIEKLESNHFQEIEALKQIQLQEIETLTQNYVEETETIKQNHSLELEAQNQAHFQKTQALKQAHMSTVEELQLDQVNKQRELTEKDKTIRTLSSQLKEIYSSTAWKMVQQLWRIQVKMRSYRTFARLEGWVRTRITQGQQNNQQSIQQAPPLRDDPHASVQPAPSLASKDKSDRFIIQYFSDDPDDLVIILTPTFFDWDGNNMFRGGAERYLIELSHLIQSLGYDPVIVQCGNFDWMRYYYDFQVIGVKITGGFETLPLEVERLNISAALIIYSPFHLASKKISIPSIGISHGVYWDNRSFQNFPTNLNKTIDDIISKLEVVSRIVSVDTNTINWLRATRSDLSYNAAYVPNFVDLNQFTPVDKPKDRLVVLYPRRLYEPRGFWLVAQILQQIIEEFDHVDFHFVGRSGNSEGIEIQGWIQQYPDRIKHYSLPPEQMHLAYQQADITIIPTIHSEGTSLSCLEAMATENAVIATNVGGLTDLIINGLNGLLIEPNGIELKKALDTLIGNPELRHDLGQNARNTVERAFTLDLWRSHWLSILRKMLPAKTQGKTKTVKSVVFPYTGIPWEGIKQRPHHIANEFVERGYEIFWGDPAGRRTPAPHIHLLNFNDELYLKNALILIYYPYNYEEITKFSDPIVIFDNLDDISIFDHVTWDDPGKTARDYYALLIQDVDIVMTSSRVLLSKICQSRPDVIYVPNGVYREHFNPENHRVSGELKGLNKPIIGFHGAVADWVDIDLIFQVALARPKYQFVLVGPVSIPEEMEKLKDLKNVRLIDSVPYERIPEYIKGFDVGILPFKVNTLTHAVRPLKVLEYLTMGKPVVATPIEELHDWPGVLLASTPEKFATELDQALSIGGLIGNPEDVERLLQQSTWPEVVRPLMDKLNIPKHEPN